MSSKRAGLGMQTTRSRGDAREAARRVGGEDQPPTMTAPAPTVAAPTVAAAAGGDSALAGTSPGSVHSPRPQENEAAGQPAPAVEPNSVTPSAEEAVHGGYGDPRSSDDDDDRPDDDEYVEDVEPERNAKAADSRPRGSQRGRSRTAAKPASLIPSRVKQHRIQIGPRLRPAVKDEFDEYIHDLANTGLTQSDVVESAIVEYMAKYPADVLREMLLGAR